MSSIAQVISAIRENPGITRPQIARMCKLSRPAVSMILRLLVEKGLVREDGTVKSNAVGRNPIKLKFNYDAFQIVGVDIGGTNLRGAILDLDGKVSQRRTESICPDDLLEQVSALIRALIEKTDTCLLGIGIGVAGTVDPASGTVFNAPALRKQNLNLAQALTRDLGLPVYVDNDVNLAAVGEHWRGAARGSKNSICISIGTGIGAGLILDGRLYRGSHNLAGEVGYFFYRDRLPEEPIYGFGDFELSAGGWGLRQRALEELEKGETVETLLHSLVEDGRSTLDAQTVVKAAMKGDVFANRLIQEASFKIGITVANVVSLLDLEAVVLTGGLMTSAAEWILPAVEEAIRYVALPEIRDKVSVRIGRLGEDAVLIGAAYQVQESELPLVIKKERG